MRSTQRKVVFSGAVAQPNEAPHASYFAVLSRMSPGDTAANRRIARAPVPGAEKSRAQLSDAVAITRSFLMQLKRRGVELRLIVGDRDRSAATVDLPLLKAVARAHRWFDEISTGKASSLAEIAAREGLAVRYVGRLIRLAFLAPDIVESIVEGRQPTSLTAEAVTRHIELPLEWRSQKTALNLQ